MRQFLGMWGLLLLQACGSSEREANPITVVDSAGVEIVVIEGEPTEDPGWPLGGSPALQLGTQNEAGPESFYRVTDIALDDRRVYVANMGTDELRVFDRTGRYVRQLGRHGFGPGEFTRLALVEVVGPDVLLTYSGGTDRYVLFDTAGQVRREFRTLEGIGGMAWPVAVLGDSQVVVAEGVPMSQLRQAGLVHDTVTLSLFATGGSRLRSLGRIPFGRRMVTKVGELIWVLSPALSPVTLMGAAGGYFCYTVAVTYQFQCLDTAGSLRRIVRWVRPARSVTQADVAEYKRNEIEKSSPDRRASMAELLDAQVFPAQLPSFSRMLTSTDGDIWLEEFPEVGAEESLWHVFQDGRAYAGSITMPSRFRLLFVSRNAIAGVWRDEMDVEYVRVYVR